MAGQWGPRLVEARRRKIDGWDGTLTLVTHDELRVGAIGQEKRADRSMAEG
jgi:hypothetical protein